MVIEAQAGIKDEFAIRSPRRLVGIFRSVVQEVACL
jgi:hypothetical protein